MLRQLLLIFVALWTLSIVEARDVKQKTLVDDQLININAQLGPFIGFKGQKQRKIKYLGVNLSGGEQGNFGDALGTTYDYPTPKDAQWFIQQGMQSIRFPIKWSRMQPPNLVGTSQLSDEIKYVDALVNYVSSNNIVINVDIHDFLRYSDNIIGSTDPTTLQQIQQITPGYTSSNPSLTPSVAQFVSFFQIMTNRYKSLPNVHFTVMNEPFLLPQRLWVSVANQAIAAARQTGFKGVLYIDGDGWSGCYSWNQTWYEYSNAQAMLNITDPLNNIVFDCHNYFNIDNSGNSPICVNQTFGVEKALNITSWLRTNKLRGIMGEVGAAMSPDCMSSVKYLLDYLEANSDVWLGANWWSAGPKWGNYFASIQPADYFSAPKNQLVQWSYYATGQYVGVAQ